MRRFIAEGFVLHDGCKFLILPQVVLLEGTIECVGQIQIDVEKEIAILRGSGKRPK